MPNNQGVPASPSGSRASHDASKLSSPKASIPNAIADAIYVELSRQSRETRWMPYVSDKEHGVVCVDGDIELFELAEAVAAAIEGIRADERK